MSPSLKFYKYVAERHKPDNHIFLTLPMYPSGKQSAQISMSIASKNIENIAVFISMSRSSRNKREDVQMRLHKFLLNYIDGQAHFMSHANFDGTIMPDIMNELHNLDIAQRLRAAGDT